MMPGYECRLEVPGVADFCRLRRVAGLLLDAMERRPHELHGICVEAACAEGRRGLAADPRVLA